MNVPLEVGTLRMTVHAFFPAPKWDQPHYFFWQFPMREITQPPSNSNVFLPLWHVFTCLFVCLFSLCVVNMGTRLRASSAVWSSSLWTLGNIWASLELLGIHCPQLNIDLWGELTCSSECILVCTLQCDKWFCTIASYLLLLALPYILALLLGWGAARHCPFSSLFIYVSVSW